MPAVTLVLWQLNYGGVEIVVRDISKALLQQGYDVTIFALRGQNPAFYTPENVEIENGHNKNLFLYPKFLWYSLFHRKHIFHLFNTGPIVIFLLNLLRVRRILYSIHGTKYWHGKWQKRIHRFFWNLSLKKPPLLIANSEFSRNIFQTEVANIDCTVIFNPFPMASLGEKGSTNMALDRLRICYVGRLSANKNLNIWLETAKALLEKYPNMHFNIYGEGSESNRIQAYAKKLAIDNKITFHGFINNISEAYYNNDLTLFLSSYESFGNVAIESILHKTPVIVSDIPSFREIFADNTNFLIKLDKRIANGIKMKLESFELLQEKTKHLSQIFREKYSLRQHIEHLKELYQDINA
jgi:glycosyltransferase involved in cell wall biosynthesis